MGADGPRTGFWRDLGGALREGASALVDVLDLLRALFWVLRVLTKPFRLLAELFDAF